MVFGPLTPAVILVPVEALVPAPTSFTIFVREVALFIVKADDQVQAPAGICTVSPSLAAFIAVCTSVREQLAALIIPPPPAEATEKLIV